MIVNHLEHERYVLKYLQFDKRHFCWFPFFENTVFLNGRYQFMTMHWLWFSADFENMKDYYRETGRVGADKRND